MLNTTLIIRRTRWNPHRLHSLDHKRFNLLTEGMTVGQFIEAHNRSGSLEMGGLGNTWHAKRYLKYMMTRGQLELPGVVIATRASRSIGPTSPLSTDLDAFTFGCEIECLLPHGMTRTEAARRVTEAGVNCQEAMYGHAVPSTWKVITDGSLGDYTRGAEFVSPVLRGTDGLQQVEKVCQALVALGAKVSKRCGFHVHVGVAGQQVLFFRTLLALYARNERLIDGLMPTSRRGSANQYCQPVVQSAAENLEGLLQSAGRSRYRKLNVAAYWRHKTVEFRQHSGTIEADKASYWIKFCLRLCLLAQTGVANQETSMQGLLSTMQASDDERTFFLNREARFAIQQQGVAGMIYTTKDGQRFNANTAAELVSQLHETSLAPAEDDATWMEDAAARAWSQTGGRVRCNSPEEFVADLIKVGLLSEEK